LYLLGFVTEDITLAVRGRSRYRYIFPSGAVKRSPSSGAVPVLGSQYRGLEVEADEEDRRKRFDAVLSSALSRIFLGRLGWDGLIWSHEPSDASDSEWAEVGVFDDGRYGA
jgi:hypothetical protein